MKRKSITYGELLPGDLRLHDDAGASMIVSVIHDKEYVSLFLVTVWSAYKTPSSFELKVLSTTPLNTLFEIYRCGKKIS